MKVIEGAEAIAEAVILASPAVVAAYPITPQTHIVESLASAVARGRLNAEFLTVESEHSAASAVLGASATGVRTFTATSSQGLLYMAEVVYDISGLRFPVVMTIANRAVSGPLSIWNDHQDSMAMRDSGWLQLFAQTPQEAHDLHLVAYRVAEDARVQLPVMVCVDGFVLTHAYEPVDLVTSDVARAFLPPYTPAQVLDPANPMSFGTYAEPAYYTEARYDVEKAMRASEGVLDEAFAAFGDLTGRAYERSGDAYLLDDARVALVAMGTAAQTARVAVDRARSRGIAAGLFALRSYRPFPVETLRALLGDVGRVVVVDRAVSPGAMPPLATEVRAALYGSRAEVAGVVAGLGGRDVSIATFERALEATRDEWVDLEASAR